MYVGSNSAQDENGLSLQPFDRKVKKGIGKRHFLEFFLQKSHLEDA